MPLFVLWDICSTMPMEPPALLWSENQIPLCLLFSKCGRDQGIGVLTICNYFGPLVFYCSCISASYNNLPMGMLGLKYI